MKIKENTKGILSLILLAFVFATMGIFARYLSSSFELFEQTYLRIGLAFLISILFFISKIDFKKIQRIPTKDVHLILLRSISLYLGIVLITQAFLTTSYSSATFVATLPLLPLFGYFILKEKINKISLLYILLGFAGFILIAIKDFSQMSLGVGELFALSSLVLFSISYVTRKLHSDFLNNYELTSIMFFIGSIFLFLTSLFIGESLPALNQFTLTTILVLLVAAFLNVANLFLTNYGFSKVKAAVAGNILTLEALFALLYGMILFNEPVILKELLGGILIVLSVILLNRKENAKIDRTS
jgi:drug/metabolite transporter (DMT)-like permease